MKKNLFKLNLPLPDKYLLVLLVGLLCFGIVMVYDSSVVYSQTVFGGKYHFLLLQSGWVTIGLLGLMFMTLIDYHLLSRFALPLLLISILLLLLVFVPGLGVEIYGARRWLPLGPFTFQPSELAKFSLILYLSAWFSSDSRRKKQLVGESHHQLIRFAVLMALIFFLILAEPNFSIAMILAGIAMMIYFVSNAPKSHFLLVILLMLGGGLVFV